jgi:predicted dehydrogenase/threonine dehydrogenase-like Zn-dependent dehydrogenase
MKQVSQNYKTGQIRLEDVKWPALKPGGVLVRTYFSLVSTGTEGMKVREGKLSYIGKARARPDQLMKVLQTARQQGVAATYQKVMNKLDSLTPLGYSLSGEVVDVGPGAEEFQVGQQVACAGAGYANHAEINFVPRNLVVPVPQNVSAKHAAFATVGAIALHGFRQAEMQLGESACVIGLGLLGQLLVQILRAGGMHVVGIDIIEERCRLAEQLGAKASLAPEDSSLDTVISRVTGGKGVDCIFITAGGSSNGPTELAVRIARDRARVVDIGKTSLDLPWNEYYLKELDVRFSRSYGPGRYDPTYEERGIDYPIGYVRWTEKRNMAAFLELVSEGKVQLDPLISSIRPFAEAEAVYQELAESKENVMAMVFNYGAALRPMQRGLTNLKATRVVTPAVGKLRLGVIGAGNYASSMLLPQLQRNGEVDLVAVATNTGLSGQNAKQKFGFKYATTEYQEILEDPAIDAVIIATRHSSHAHLVAEALRNGKTTYVEKPLALGIDELEMVRLAIIESGNDRLMVGFNRRFAPMVTALAHQFWKVRMPIVAHYRVHAGQLEKGSWYLDEAEGSRFVGEAGHFFDVFAYFTRSRPVSVVAMSLRPQNVTKDDLENVAATVQYEDGSIGNLLYLTQGGSKLPKEYLEIFGGGKTSQMSNFESIVSFEGSSRRREQTARMDKGQRNELAMFIEAVKKGKPMPIGIDVLFDNTVVPIAAVTAVTTGNRVYLHDFWAKIETAHAGVPPSAAGL